MRTLSNGFTFFERDYLMDLLLVTLVLLLMLPVLAVRILELRTWFDVWKGTAIALSIGMAFATGRPPRWHVDWTLPMRVCKLYL